ncbi:putative disease resistance RPP8-like protein 3 [Cocos nucifera]|uniref:Putative disease resistance RPP8-like protein 3 n=1 Tax=Cocos nucifera TaxID=13894 RepID=A0A8K0HSQ1_COCNU|nr:putative disease resistance RPP8-like protein 3 [Cocos nucifera]
MYINFLLFLSAPIGGDHKNLRILSINFSERHLDKPNVMDMIHSLGGIIRFIKNWVTTSGSTHPTCERIFSESFGKSLDKVDGLLSFTMYVKELPIDIFFAHARHLQKLRSLYLRGGRFQQQQLPDSAQFPPNLTKLILRESELAQDPMPVLEKLPNLRLLQPFFAYVVVFCWWPSSTPTLDIT